MGVARLLASVIGQSRNIPVTRELRPSDEERAALERLLFADGTGREAGRYVVLDRIDPEDAYPAGGLWVVRRPEVSEQMRRRLEGQGLAPDSLTTAQVAGWFRSRAKGVSGQNESEPTWAPAAHDSFAVTTLGGDTGDVVDTTDDQLWPSNFYWWYDLDDVADGGIVYRISSRGTAWVFLRDGDGWQAFVAEADSREAWEFNTLVEGVLTAYHTMTT